MGEWTVTGDGECVRLHRFKASARINTGSDDGKTPENAYRAIEVPVFDMAYPETAVVMLTGAILHTYEGDPDEAADVLAEALIRGARACRNAMREMREGAE